MCVGQKLMLPATPSVEDAKALVRKLYQTQGVRVVVLFTTEADTRLILQATQELGLAGKYQTQWLRSGGRGGWSVYHRDRCH